MNFFKSSIGKKILMAVTGLAMVGFIVAHLLGNLQIFISPDKFNTYAAFLKSLGEILWIARLGLIAMVVVHVTTAIALVKENNAAKPIGYRVASKYQATTASLYMFHSGMILLLFIAIHLLHFTLGVVQPQFANLFDSQGRHDVYSMVIYGFQSLPYAIFYIIAMLCLGLHLSHAISSMFQTIGISGPKITPLLKKASQALSIIIVTGYISIPLAVISGQLGV